MSLAIMTELEYVLRILAAGICGGVIGYERKNRNKAAGSKTHVIVAVSSALMIIISKYGFYDVLGEYIKLDPSRVAAGVVTAIGFIGSGVILFKNNRVSGLTTSAGIWATVGVGMAEGAGMYLIGVITTAMIILVEVFLGRRGVLADKQEEDRKIIVEYIDDIQKSRETTGYVKKLCEERGYRILAMETRRMGEKIQLQTMISASKDYDAADMTAALTEDRDITKIVV